MTSPPDRESDRALLEAAASAAGYAWTQLAGWRPDLPRDDASFWNPLTDAGDRYRLARRLGLILDFSDSKKHAVRFWIDGWPRAFTWPASDERAEAESIVRAAAALGKEMP